MRFIKRYKARRAKRKEIKKAYKDLTSKRVQLGAASFYTSTDKLHRDIQALKDKISKHEKELCKL